MLQITNPLGLHARAAAQLVRLANSFESTIHVSRNDNSVPADAKSILSVLALAASLGTVLTIKVEGDDETKAFDEIVRIFENGFGEL